MTTKIPDLAFYYPAFMWQDPNWVKSIILYFDGVALLVPSYMKDRPFGVDPAIAQGLQDHGLLTILEPETFIDKASAEKLVSQLVDVLTSDVLDDLDRDRNAFAELSYSRLGYRADPELAEMVIEELQRRGLAAPTEDGVSIPVHRKVHSLILVLLAQILREPGRQQGLNLHPATDRPNIHAGLKDLLGHPAMPSAGNVVSLDLETVGVDLGPIPIDEVLAFRAENGEAFRKYSADLRTFLMRLSFASPEDRESELQLRQEQIRDAATDLANISRQAWKKPVSMALGIAGAAWAAKTGDWVTGILGAGAAIVGAGLEDPNGGSAYSYLFGAQAQLSR